MVAAPVAAPGATHGTGPAAAAPGGTPPRTTVLAVLVAVLLAVGGAAACSDVGTVGAPAGRPTATPGPTDDATASSTTSAEPATASTAGTVPDTGATTSPPGVDTTAPGRATDGSVTPPTTSAPTVGAVIELEDAGDAPRTQLRLTAGAGVTQPLTHREELTLVETVDGETRPTGGGTIEVRMTSVVEAADEERFTMELTCESISVTGAGGALAPADETTAPTRADIEERVGCGDRLTLTRRNELVERRAASTHLYGQPLVDMPLLADLRLVPLPDEPVGTGARWRTRRTADHLGLPYEVRHDALLTAFDGTAASISFSTTATLHQVRTLAADGRRVDVDGEVELTATGHLRLELDQPLALESSTSVITITGTMTAGGARLEAEQRVDVDRAPR